MNNRILMIVLLPLSIIGGWKVRGWMDQSSIRLSDAYHPGIEQLQLLSSLVTARVEVADVMTSDLNGYTGGVRIAILIKGDCLVGTDLSQAKFEKIDAIAHCAELVLTEPTVTSARLDLNQTHLYMLTCSGLLQITPDTDQSKLFMLNRAYAQAQQVVSGAGKQPETMQRAKLQAEVTLTGFFKALQWDVSIRWTHLSADRH